MIAGSLRERVVWYFLLALIVGFFAIPLSVFCFFDSRLMPAPKFASILLFFFR